jgi:hypothetical protein
MQLMKKIMILMVLLLAPNALWAMTPITEADLSGITGQAGVNINADVTMNIGIGTVAWGDASGVDAYASLGSGWAAVGSTGYVGVTNFNINNLRIKARETDTYGTGYNTTGTAGTAPNAYNTLYLKPITIDVATDMTGIIYNGATFVRFGLGSLQITMDSLSFRVALGSDTSLAQEMGTLNLGAMAVYINPKSYIDFYKNPSILSHSGLCITMDILVDQFDLNYISWGDTDGLAGGNTGTGGVTWISTAANSSGYIGLQDLKVGGPITVTGTIAIDVVSTGRGIYSHNGVTPVTVCHIFFPKLFNLNVTGPITANVRLDNVAVLNSANAGTLGDIYLAAFNVGIQPGSWVDIWAH